MASGSIPFRSSILLRMDCSAVKAIALWFNAILLNWIDGKSLTSSEDNFSIVMEQLQAQVLSIIDSIHQIDNCNERLAWVDFWKKWKSENWIRKSSDWMRQQTHIVWVRGIHFKCYF